MYFVGHHWEVTSAGLAVNLSVGRSVLSVERCIPLGFKCNAQHTTIKIQPRSPIRVMATSKPSDPLLICPDDMFGVVVLSIQAEGICTVSRKFAYGYLPARGTFGGGRSLFSPLFGCLPSAPRTQAALVEMLSQALAAKVTLPDAIDVVSQMMHGFPMGDLQGRAAGMMRAGEEVPDSLRWAGLRLHTDIQAAFGVGEFRGGLGEELAAAARRLDVRVADHVAAAIGRRRTARRFATSLARLLAHEPLTFDLVHHAARLVGARDRHFRHVIRWLALDVEGGLPLADVLGNYSRVFDPLFVNCVANAQSRQQMRDILSRIGTES
jgi:hypothetical protein